MSKLGRPEKKKRKRGIYGEGTACQSNDGYWVYAAYYIDLEGNKKRLYKKAKSKEEAVRRFNKALEELNIIDGIQQPENHTPSDDITLRDLLEQLAKDGFQLPRHSEYKKPIESRTIASYVWVASKIDDFMGDTCVKDITEEHIRFMLKVYRNGNAELGVKPASQSFLSKLFYVTRIALDYAVQVEVIDNNIMRSLDLGKPKAIKESKQIKGYSKEEIQSMYNAFEKQSILWEQLKESERYRRPVIDLYLAFNLMLFTGMRSEEVRALFWRDVDFQEGILSINKAMSLSYKIDKLKISEAGAKLGKTKNLGSVRDISINDQMLNLFEQVRKYNLKRGISCKEDDLIFQSDRYKEAWTGNGFSKSLNDVLKFCGCEIRLAPHRLRHTCATIMEIQKANDHEIMTQLGLTQYSTVRVYTDRGKGIQRNNSNLIDKGILEEFGIELQDEGE